MQDASTFSKFLNRKGVQLVCEVCSSSQWSMADANAGLSLALPVHQEGVPLTRTAMVPAYALICQNCGNIRFHAAAIVDPKTMVPATRERNAPGASPNGQRRSQR